MPFIATSRGILTCCSICSAEIPGHWVMMSTKLVKRDRSPPKQKKGRCEDQKPVVQGKIYKPTNHLLLHRVLEHQRILNHLYARFDAGNYFLHVSRKHLPVHHFH